MTRNSRKNRGRILQHTVIKKPGVVVFVVEMAVNVAVVDPCGFTSIIGYNIRGKTGRNEGKSD